MVYLYQVIKSNLKTIYTLTFSSQGRACALQWFHLNYSMKNLVDIDYAYSEFGKNFIPIVTVSFFMAWNSLNTFLWKCRLQSALVGASSERHHQSQYF